MTTQPDLKPNPPNTDVEVKKTRINARAMVWAAVLSALIGGILSSVTTYAVATRQDGSSRPEAARTDVATPSPGVSSGTQNASDRAMIITPRGREKVGLCPAIRGIAPSDSGDAYWLAIQQIDAQKPYLYKRISVDPARQPQWDLGNVPIARPDQVNQDFDLLLIHTSGDLTQMFANNVGQDVDLPSGAQVVDRVRVTRTAAPACPFGD